MTKKWIAGLVLISALPGFGELTLSAVFNLRMVLQRDQPVPVWGTEEPGQTVTVEFAGQTKSAVAGLDGKWRVTLDPMAANSTPQNLTVSSPVSAAKVIQEVLVGEVWLCSGQSNMNLALKYTENATDAIAAANYASIRVFVDSGAGSTTPVDFGSGWWRPCTSKFAADFSAVAYYFGRKLHLDLNVPVGLLVSTQSGTTIEPWTPACGFEGMDSLAYILEILENPPADPSKLKQFPTALFNGKIHPHIPYAIRGAIWYQGESNIRDGMLYLDKSKALINGWRSLWGTEFPFYLVQIAPFNDQYASDIAPQFWEAQSEIVRQIPNTGMAVISDAATLDNIHPPNKEVPGIRLALLAEAKTYGMDVISSGPVFQTLEKLDGTLKVTFDSAEGLTTRDGLAPDWFEIAGEDGVFKPAQAEITGPAVILSSADVSNPCSVRFAWSKLAMPNLMNGAGLPAPAFRGRIGGGLFVSILGE